MSPSVDTTLRVRYAETDAQGVVYHANYIVFFEVGRGAFLRAVGIDYNALEASGCFIVVAEAQARYLAPARYDDELVITTEVASLRSRSFTFRYVVQRGETRIAEGTTAHVCVGLDGKAMEIPAALRAAFEGAEG